MKESVQVEQQTELCADGGIRESEEAVETDFTDWDAYEPMPERETKIEQEAASEFGVDDRSDRGEIEAGEQETLFMDVEEDQVTLGGDRAAEQSRWEQ